MLYLRDHSLRTLTTESTAVLILFKTQELCHPNGVCFGQNAVSGNMIRIDRSKLLNSYSFRLAEQGILSARQKSLLDRCARITYGKLPLRGMHR